MHVSCTHVVKHNRVHTHTQRERERERERDIDTDIDTHTHTHTDTHTQPPERREGPDGLGRPALHGVALIHHIAAKNERVFEQRAVRHHSRAREETRVRAQGGPGTDDDIVE